MRIGLAFFRVSRVEKVGLVLLVVVAGLVRGLYVGWQGPLLTPDSTSDYLPLARQLAVEGRYEELWPDGVWRPTCYRTPGYPLFLAAFYREGAISLQAVMGVQVLLSALTVGLTYFMGLVLAGRKVAWGAALVQAFSLFMIPASAMILAEALLGFLLVLGWVFFIGERRWGWVLSGVVWGYASLVKSVGLLVLLALGVVGIGYRVWRRRALVVLGAALLVIAPWSIRCTMIYKRLMVLPSIGYGSALHHAAVASGGCIGWFTEKAVEDCGPMEASFVRLKRGLDELSADRYAGAVGLARIWADPAAWLGRRLLAYPRLIFHNGDYFLRSRSKSLLAAYRKGDWLVLLVKAAAWIESFLMVLGMGLGLIYSWRRQRAVFWLVGFPLLSVLAAHLPMWIETRYLMPFLPFAHVLASYGWWELIAAKLLHGSSGRGG